MAFETSAGFKKTNQETETTQALSERRALDSTATTNQQLTDIINSIKNSLSQTGQISQTGTDLTTQAGVDEDVLPFLQRLLQGGEQAFEQPRQFFPGSTVADPSETERLAEGDLINRLFGGTDLQRASEQETLRTLGGVENPFLSETVQSAIRPVEESFRENVLPQLNANFIGSGRTGSGAADRATQTANRDFSRNIGDIASRIGFQSFEAERGRQQQASQFAPQLAGARTAELGQLRDIGRSRTGDDQRRIDEAVKRFQFGQEAPRQDAERLTDLINSITGQFGRTTQAGRTTGDVSTTTQAQETNQQVQNQVIDILKKLTEQQTLDRLTETTEESESREFSTNVSFRNQQ